MFSELSDVVLRKYNSEDLVFSNYIFAKYFHPKLALIYSKRHVIVVDVESKSSKSENGSIATMDHQHETEADIVDVFLQEQLLWLLLDTSQLAVFDLLSGLEIPLVTENLRSYNFKTFKTDGVKIYLISENEECLMIPHSVDEILGKLRASEEIHMQLIKTRGHITLRTQNFYDCIEPKQNITGLHLDIERGALIVECPVTGIRAVAAPIGTYEWTHVMPWCEMAVLTGSRGIWIVHLKDTQVALALNSDGVLYQPLASWKDHFYYLSLKEKEICIHQIQKSFTFIEETSLSNTTANDIQKHRTQVSLVVQLDQLVQSVITDSMSPSNTLAQLKLLFNEIVDVAYLLAKAITLCQHDIYYKPLLEFLYMKVENNEVLSKEICDILFKVEILEYMYLFYNDKYEKLHVFKSNFVNLCITFISNSDLDLASITWLKFFRMQTAVRSEDIIAILNATPHNIKMNAFMLWLKNFIPPLIDHNPFYIDLFAKWTTDRVFSFEKSMYWPKIGVKFIDDIISVLELSQSKFITIRPTSMDGLDILKVHITKILELKEKYKINMLLGELSSLSPSEVALIMLHRCYTEDLEQFLHDYMSAFAAENCLELDDILKAYIERETLDHGGGVDEVRLRAILDAFCMSTCKLECLLDVLRTLDVPWSSTMYELAIKSVSVKDKDFAMCDSDLQLVHQIKMELNFANLKVVLKKYNFPLNCTDYLLVLHKVASAVKVDLNDLTIVVRVLSGYSHYGSMLYINRCLQEYSVNKALDFYNTLNELEKKVILKAAMTKYEFIINGVYSNSAMERSYLDFVKGTHALNEVRMSKMEDMYHLKNSYNIKISLNDMSNEKVVSNQITDWFTSNGYGASTGRGACLASLAHLPYTFDTALVDLLSQISADTKVQSLVEDILTTFTKSNVSRREIESIMANFNDSKNSCVLWDCCLVLVQIICNCPEEYLHSLINILTILNAIVNTSITIKHLTLAWKFHYICVPMSNISSTADLISFYVDILSQKVSDGNIIGNAKVKSDFVPIRMLSSYTSNNILFNLYPDNIFLETKDKFAKKLISNILLSQVCDELLLACSLLLLNSTNEHDHRGSPENLFQALEGASESVLSSMTKYLASPMLCEALALDNVLHLNTVANCPKYTLKTRYNLNVIDLALPDITEETLDAKIVLYYVLKNYPDTSTQRLVDYCLTLDLDIDDGLSLQLISLLVGWDIKYKLYLDEFDCQQVKYENNENKLISKCILIWDSIKNKTFLIDILKDFWRNGEVSLHGRLVSINPYYYEVYLCIYTLISSHIPEWRNSKEFFLLNFLMDYERFSSPKQYEFELFSVKGMFPEIGYYRLPFLLFMREDMWSNLKTEITLATYEQWLPVADLLCLDADLQTARDMLCSNALKQTMTARKRNNEIKSSENHNESWRLQAREESLLRAAHRCVCHIANMEWAGACLFYVLQGCARGADQVAAAQLCYQFAQRWAALQPANRAVRQMHKLHSSLSTRHALHKINWACEELLRFTAEPTQLVRSIYFHPDFTNRMLCYNVNRTVDDIADKNNINISSIRIQILESILEQNSDDKRNKRGIGLDNQDLMRAKFILKATCPKMGAIYLARIALDDDTNFHKSKKLRSLQCLISAVEADTALKVTNKERESLWSTLIDLFFAIRLENIDMPWAMGTFAKDKIQTLQQVFSASENGIESLRVATELTLRYGCDENTRTLVPRLLSTKLYDELSVLLSKTFTYPDELICNAWSVVLLAPFLHADYPITDRQRQSCLKVINMMPLCPYISDEILKKIWVNCVRIRCLAIGCLVLPFMSVEARLSLPELQKIDKRNIIAGIKNLQTECYLINGSLSVLDSIVNRKLC